MFCTKCGKELPEGAKFCIYCGADTAAIVTGEPEAAVQESVPVEAAETAPVAPEAEVPVAPDAEAEVPANPETEKREEPVEEHDVLAAPEEEAPVPAAKKKGMSGWLIAVIAAAAALVVCAAVYFIALKPGVGGVYMSYDKDDALVLMPYEDDPTRGDLYVMQYLNEIDATSYPGTWWLDGGVVYIHLDGDSDNETFQLSLHNGLLFPKDDVYEGNVLWGETFPGEFTRESGETISLDEDGNFYSNGMYRGTYTHDSKGILLDYYSIYRRGKVYFWDCGTGLSNIGYEKVK